MNRIINETGGDSTKLGEILGVDNWDVHTLIRMDVESPNSLNPRLPDASISGANNKFILGGKTSGGVSEVVTDAIPAYNVWPTKVDVSENHVGTNILPIELGAGTVLADSVDKSARTPVSRAGQQNNFPDSSAPKFRNPPETINGRNYSGHARERLYPFSY